MRTLLQIVQTAAKEMGLPSVSAVVNSTDLQIQQLYGLANRVGSDLAQEEGAWQRLRAEQLITLVPGTASYAFPTDFAYYVPNTAWDRTAHWRLDGPMSANDWQVLKSGIFPSGVYARFRIMNNQIWFDPVPASADTIAIEYVSANWCQSAGAVGQSSFLADTDTPLLPDDLFILGIKWRLKAEKGFDFSAEQADYDKALSRMLPRDTMLETIPIGRRASSWLNPGLLPAGSWPGR